ncbi:MAG: NarK/NasA family nitrate transporter [Chloroflexi bacterium]|jgi:MFS transporter, NNP family, nitrate/nitrite transporter|nr:NarK/NasA family nitrate transporter [Chloroflexota bacterium]MBT3670328.1 NarK/NasA family nitrate transporter [Chloroflexota bacterium]MBT4002608.1 NarK/NasA family nitrate transporter [Chloroflexota bacterium]MBT4305516.1 NarK/NasA family nitrate transporter [Chloroflexota bacterium]MBT4533127.1 NarK/NasA family nitrate transporter [Chloroflexota bacterium]
MKEQKTAYTVLALNTLAFTVCFAAWMLNGVLVTFLVDNGVFNWDAAQMGVLIGIPVLTGSIMRLPLGVLTDKYGGRPVYAILMLLSAIPMYLLGQANSYNEFLIYSLGFGMTGASFAVGIAFSSVWFSKEKQGTALGIFGAGNAGAALTTMGAPSILRNLTDGGANIEGWRQLPQIYAIALAVMAVIFYIFSTNKKPASGQRKLIEMLAPLKNVRVWRFGLYYFLVFGGFVALAQWLVPYYVNVYAMSIVTAGLLTSIFSLPSGLIRAVGGVLSDRVGARVVMYWVLGSIAVCTFLLFFPKMEIESPGSGIMARRGGTVTAVSETEIHVGNDVYTLDPVLVRDVDDTELILLPKVNSWHEAKVSVGDQVLKKELLAQGITHIYFQANVWVFTVMVFVIGIAMGIGKAAVYKYIPEYFPDEVGVVGGIVGVVGGLGGFVSPIIFGRLLKSIGLWTTTWMFFFLITLTCLIWLSIVVRKITKKDTRIEASAS